MNEPSKIADELELMRYSYVYSTTGGVMLAAHESRDQIMHLIGLPTEGTSMMNVRSDGSEHWIVLDKYFEPGPGIDAVSEAIMHSWASLMCLTMGHRLKESGLSTRPLFEFVRHLRNAVAHGETFTIDHWKGTAQFDHLIITPDHNGIRLWDFLTAGDVLALLDAVILELRAEAVASNQRDAPSPLPKE
ncbi:hypothetical protein [Rathayibacter sp. VKM Ac-2760]|uniref:hypothetical protein n=1 Tax=Rathayibacter sp. VKM Ac-2760 TaxID=2609253 RepID=UPI00131636C3|nr:hypothetical protein [Rathayibacter sp. VKM Ac-2760]QHC59613.1 hypothetical protein GSU72_14410 [Rathayibacter sp. VKM Ac-2760]